MGWSQRKLGRELYIARFEDDDLEEMVKCENNVRKHLQRSTVQPEVLQAYLDIIYLHPDFLKIDLIRPVYLKDDAIDPGLEQELKRISQGLTRDLKKAELYEE